MPAITGTPCTRGTAWIFNPALHREKLGVSLRGFWFSWLPSLSWVVSLWVSCDPFFTGIQEHHRAPQDPMSWETHLSWASPSQVGRWVNMDMSYWQCHGVNTWHSQEERKTIRSCSSHISSHLPSPSNLHLTSSRISPSISPSSSHVIFFRWDRSTVETGARIPSGTALARLHRSGWNPKPRGPEAKLWEGRLPWHGYGMAMLNGWWWLHRA